VAPVEVVLAPKTQHGSRFSHRPAPPRPTSEVPRLPSPSSDENPLSVMEGELGKRTFNRRRRKPSGAHASAGGMSASGTSATSSIGSNSTSPATSIVATNGTSTSNGSNGASGSEALDEAQSVSAVVHWIYTAVVFSLMMFFVIPLLVDVNSRLNVLGAARIPEARSTDQLHQQLDMLQSVLTRLSANITESASYLDRSNLSTQKQWADYWAEKAPAVVSGEALEVELLKYGDSLARGGFISSWERVSLVVGTLYYVLSRLWAAAFVVSAGVYSLYMAAQWLGLAP
jgi:hypothetical protein